MLTRVFAVPEIRCQKALLATGNTGDAEAAMNWLVSECTWDPATFVLTLLLPVLYFSSHTWKVRLWRQRHPDRTLTRAKYPADPDIDAPIDLSAYALASGGSGSGAAAAAPDTSALEDMGFSKAQAIKALRVNGGNIEIAVAWLFENPDDPGEEPGAASAESDAGPSGGSTGAGAPAGDSSLPALYKLKSFISHKGPSVHSGHYVAHVRKLDSDDGWVLFK